MMALLFHAFSHIHLRQEGIPHPSLCLLPLDLLHLRVDSILPNLVSEVAHVGALILKPLLDLTQEAVLRQASGFLYASQVWDPVGRVVTSVQLQAVGH